MKTSDFYYELPKELIAQDPLEDRASSRLMCLSRQTGKVEHHTFRDILQFLDPGDTLVINNTKVIPARLIGEKEGTGGAVEVLLLSRVKGQEATWETLVRPGKKCRPGARIVFGGGLLTAEVTDVVEDGNRYVKFFYDGVFEEILDKLGEMPLPPYITHRLEDRTRYNTVYAKLDGSAAAPTAGLHFTKELLEEIRAKGVNIAELTLHVGLGTFRPVKVDDVETHHMHTEHCMITPQTAKLINDTHASGHRVIAVGTTSCRTLESMAQEDGTVRSGEMDTSIFIYPGYRFKVMDALITNFHLPESTLVMLVSAFAGKDHIMAAYEEAVKERYRFFSFGDAMYIG
ncbi:MAG TPA: tRNA preQ1(34) S-adenosylmethionine ribosyltransferase-isomerase QueA [Lachnospiraceae bacterium]|jgi:S-adenosylmethionine:tRNA ribosyltransferase-isomerase|nr:tRNA preQ1(34) S-adenosylmethionine ribosyltransferase-isomerase QueA [Lachnospiraceae bacterium]